MFLEVLVFTTSSIMSSGELYKIRVSNGGKAKSFLATSHFIWGASGAFLLWRVRPLSHFPFVSSLLIPPEILVFCFQSCYHFQLSFYMFDNVIPKNT
jgi:hypothetical protein